MTACLRGALGAAAGLLLLSLSGPAAADAADDALKEGRDKLAAGDVAAACEAFAKSQAARPQGATLLELGLCHEKEGKIATAWEELIDAAAAARKERNTARENKATKASRALEARLPQLTLTLPEGDFPDLAIAIDGKPIDRSAWTTPMPVDPGEREVTATASGKKPWRAAISVKEKQKATLTVGPFEDEEVAPPEPPAAAPEPVAPVAAAEEPPPEPPSHGDRLVVEVGFLIGLGYGASESGDFPGVGSLDYVFPTTQGDFVQVCGKDNCTASFDERASLVLGGQLFAAWALSPDVHLGARGLVMPRIGGGFLAAGGPSISARVLPAPLDRMWIGASFLLGGMEQTADVATVRGVGPRGLKTPSGDAEVDVALNPDASKEGTVTTGFAVGGQLEVTYALVDWDVLQGSVMVGLWPTVLVGGDGFGLAIPAGIAYRFH